MKENIKATSSLYKMEKEKDITIRSFEFEKGPIKIFEPIYALVESTDGFFSSHPGRYEINGVKPSVVYVAEKMKGKKFPVLLFSTLENRGCVRDVIVLTDGMYSYWFLYEGEYKNYIKII